MDARTTNPKHLKENPGALQVVLTAEDLQPIEDGYAKIKVHGERTSPALPEISDDMS